LPNWRKRDIDGIIQSESVELEVEERDGHRIIVLILVDGPRIRSRVSILQVNSERIGLSSEFLFYLGTQQIA
jgi:hypothetical protein